MQTSGGGENVWYLYVLPFVVPAITALIMFLRKEGKSEASAGLLSYEVDGLQSDLKEVKEEVKNVDRKSSDALRMIDIINLRIQNLEDYNRRKDSKGAV